MKDGVVAITLGSSGAPAGVAPGDHLVQFYADDRELARVVGDYLVSAAGAGAAAVVIATPEHRQAFEQVLAAAGLPAPAPESTSSTPGEPTVGVVPPAAPGGHGPVTSVPPIIWLDAAETLGQLMTGDHPDAAKFDDVVGGLIRSALDTHTVHAYGEMVALLWQSGNVEGAMELEAMWSGLGEQLRFALLCAYPSDVVSGPAGSERLVELSANHAHATRAPRRTIDSEFMVEQFPPVPESPAAARHLVTETLEAWGKAPATTTDAELIVSELATNAVVHGGSTLAVSVVRLKHGVRLEVTDSGSGTPRRALADVTASSGRGLAIVDAIASRWGVDYRPDGKTVWAELTELDGDDGRVVPLAPPGEVQ